MTAYLFVKIIICILGFFASLILIALFIDAVVMDFMPKRTREWWE